MCNSYAARIKAAAFLRLCGVRLRFLFCCKINKSDNSEFDDGYRVSWGNLLPITLEERDKPVKVDHYRHFLQLFHRGYHQFTTHAPEGMATCFKVLIGSILLIILDTVPDFNDFQGRGVLYQKWNRANIQFAPGTPSYATYMTSPLSIVYLTGADCM